MFDRLLVNTLPLTDQTKHILNQKAFDLLPDHSYLIHIGRAGHLDQSALLNALRSGKLARAVLDVFETEPLPSDHLLWKHPQIEITPHISGVFSILENVQPALEMCERFVEKKKIPPGNVVDLKKGY